MKQIVNTADAPKPVGPYNQAVIANGMIFTAGQIAIDPATNTVIEGTVEEQTRQVMKNLGAVLSAAGVGYRDVIKTTVFLLDMNDFSVMNGVYGEFFQENAPARSAVEVRRLPKDVRVEIECIAVLPVERE